MYSNNLLVGHCLSITGVSNRNSTIVKQAKIINSRSFGISSVRTPVANNGKSGKITKR